MWTTASFTLPAVAFALVLTLAWQLNFAFFRGCPKALNATIFPNSGDTLTSTYKTLVACPQIEALDLSLLSSGCIILSGAHWAFSFQRGDRFPQLKSLSLHGYNPDELTRSEQYAHMLRWWLSWAWAWVMGDEEDMKAPRHPRPEGPNLERWLKAMDWHALESLQLHEPRESFARLLRNQLPVLRELMLVHPHTGWKSDDVKQFWNGTGPTQLRKLAMVNFLTSHDALEAYVEAFPDLETLELRNYEVERYGASKAVLTASQIERIGRSHSRLTELSLDIYRNGTWPEEIFMTIASIPQLKAVSLWLEVGSDESRKGQSLFSHHESYRKPLASVNSATEVFEILRRQKVGSELQRMTIFLGDVGRDYGWGMRIPSWLEGKGRKFECNVLDRKGRRKSTKTPKCEEVALKSPRDPPFRDSKSERKMFWRQ